MKRTAQVAFHDTFSRHIRMSFYHVPMRNYFYYVFCLCGDYNYCLTHCFQDYPLGNRNIPGLFSSERYQLCQIFCNFLTETRLVYFGFLSASSNITIGTGGEWHGTMFCSVWSIELINLSIYVVLNCMRTTNLITTTKLLEGTVYGTSHFQRGGGSTVDSRHVAPTDIAQPTIVLKVDSNEV